MTTLMWFRDDLRLADNPALHAAREEDLVCVYILDEESPEVRPPGGAAKWWLHHSLVSLAQSLAQHGIPLILRRGPAERLLPILVEEAGANRVVWNRRYGPERALDARIKERLQARGHAAESFPGNLLFEPWTVRSGQGTPYRVFTPFWHNLLDRPAPPAPLPAPPGIRAAPHQPASDLLASWQLLPVSPDWAGGLARRWLAAPAPGTTSAGPGESGAATRLERFLTARVEEYAGRRDVPAASATSELSPHLRWGEISPRQVWHRTGSAHGSAAFLAELGWREFAWHTLFHNPDLTTRNLAPRFDAFPWREHDARELGAWQQGRTGVPLVDAGMRELLETGHMHGRVRMVTASYLTKHLLTDWRVGEEWFWDTLVDADRASNPFNWQWVAGSGWDAAPYFRVFNPVLQAKKFDPDGAYTRRWAPSSTEHEPVIDLAVGRERALAAYAQIRP